MARRVRLSSSDGLMCQSDWKRRGAALPRFPGWIRWLVADDSVYPALRAKAKRVLTHCPKTTE